MKPQTHKHLLNKLHQLIKTCNDSRLGYETCMSCVEDLTLKEIFIDFSTQRATFACELREQYRLIQGKAYDNFKGTFTGWLHRCSIYLRSLISKPDSKSVLQECITGENEFLKTFREFIELENLPLQTQSIVEGQIKSVSAAFNMLKTSHEMLENSSVV